MRDMKENKTGSSTYSLSDLTRAPKVDDFQSGALGVLQQDVLGLKVAMDDADAGRGQEHQGIDNLLRKLAHEVERNTAEVRIANEIVEVEGEQLEDKT